MAAQNDRAALAQVRSMAPPAAEVALRDKELREFAEGQTRAVLPFCTVICCHP